MKNKLSVQVGIIISVFLVLILAAVEALMIVSSTIIFLRSKNETFNRDLRLVESDFSVIECSKAALEYISENTERVKEPLTDDELSQISLNTEYFGYGSSNEEFEKLPELSKHYHAQIFYNTMDYIMRESVWSFNYEHVYLFEIIDGRSDPVVILEGKPEKAETDMESLGTVSAIDLRLSEMMRFMTSGNTDEDTHYEIIEADSGKVYYAGYRRVLTGASHRYVLCAFYNWSSFRDMIVSAMIPTTIVFFIIIVIANVLIIRFIYIKAVKPVTAIQKSVRGYTETRDTARIVDDLSKITAKNEFGALAGDVSRLTGEIEQYTKESARLSTELDMAASIQLSQLPRKFPAFPDRTEFDVFASMDPAKEVGGDFYDFFLIDDDHLALVIADVSGKGIPAALFMMASKILIKNYASMGGTPSEILMTVNDRICESNPDNMFVTVWLGIIDLNTGVMTCCNAGHEYPMLKKAGGRFEKVPDKHGLFVGAMPGLRYKDYEIRLEKGDTFFTYTDGVPEATDASNELFGEDRMIEALNASESDGLPEILSTVRAHVDAFVGEAPQFDDLTMLAFRYFGKE